MESSKITPFGEYGINITDYREKSISKTDMTRLRDCEYLMDRGCYFDIYKWDGNKTYDKVLTFNGDNFTKETAGGLFNGIPSMHMWFETIDDLQKWLGQYYDSAITAMLANKNHDTILNTQYTGSTSGWLSGVVNVPWNSNNQSAFGDLYDAASYSYSISNSQQAAKSAIGVGIGSAQNTTDKIDELLKGL